MTSQPPPAPPSAVDSHDDADPLAFAPAPSASTRHDGWTPERQRRFVAALGVMGVVGRAARSVGMSATSAYKLRARVGADGFAAAWDAALDQGRERAWDVAMDRALNGVVVPRFYRGRQVGVSRRFDYRLALAALYPPPPAAGRSARDREGE